MSEHLAPRPPPRNPGRTAIAIQTITPGPDLPDHVLVTPTVHRRHHDEDLPPANFAGTFAIVDRIFGTWAGPSAAQRSS